FAKMLGFGGLFTAASTTGLSEQGVTGDRSFDDITQDLYAEVVTYPMDDTHCHASNDQRGQTTTEQFLLDLSLPALPEALYFPAGVLESWREAKGAAKAALDRQYGIQKTLDEIRYHFRESMFVKYLTKELATFLGCAPKLETVVAARNERAKDYHRYISDLFRDVKITNAMVDTGCCEGMGVNGFNGFAQAIRPCQMRGIARAETIYNPLMREDISFEELDTRYREGVRKALDGDGNFGFKSWGMKSHLL